MNYIKALTERTQVGGEGERQRERETETERRGQRNRDIESERQRDRETDMESVRMRGAERVQWLCNSMSGSVHSAAAVRYLTSVLQSKTFNRISHFRFL